VPIRGAYTVKDEAGLPFLIPSLDSTHLQGDKQMLLVRSKDGPQKKAADGHCSIDVSLFSLSPSARGLNQWEYRSPSASGWANETTESDIYESWKTLLQGLASSQGSECFSPDQDLFSIERVLAAATSLPASEIQAFLYSYNKAGYVDLAPGMELLIQASPSTTAIHNRSIGKARLHIKQRQSGGVSLRGSPDFFAERLPEFESGNSGQPARRYASQKFLRLFLQSLSDDDSRQNPLLLGASDVQSLDDATRAVQSSSHTSCATVQRSVICTVFPNGVSVSLLIPIWINGHRTDYPLGTQLGFILAQLTKSEQEAAVKSVRVERPLADGGFAQVMFPRTSEGPSQVILLAGDRIRWDAGAD
jgi:hypothetical protein